MTDHRPKRFHYHTNTWLLTGNNDFTSRYIHDRSQATTIPLAHKKMTAHRPQRFKKHTNTWPITCHNDFTSTHIHAKSQATTIQQSHKYMPEHRPQRFNNHTNTWPILPDFLWTLNFLLFWPIMQIRKKGGWNKKKSSPLKQPNFAEMILGWSSSKIVSGISEHRPRWLPQPNLI